MLIPSIDLMGGKIVQLIQGEKKALEFEDSGYWIERFSSFPLVQLIDLDAAMGKGNNQELVSAMCRSLPCQAGGGIHSVKRARELLQLGARRVILGSALVKHGSINSEFCRQCAKELGPEKLAFAADSRAGKVAIRGWTESTEIDPLDMVQTLEPYCSAFLYTHIETEGTMNGFPLAMAGRLRRITSRQVIVAGGIRSTAEVAALDEIGVDAVVGMAIYTGAIGE